MTDSGTAGKQPKKVAKTHRGNGTGQPGSNEDPQATVIHSTIKVQQHIPKGTGKQGDSLYKVDPALLKAQMLTEIRIIAGERAMTATISGAIDIGMAMGDLQKITDRYRLRMFLENLRKEMIETYKESYYHIQSIRYSEMSRLQRMRVRIGQWITGAGTRIANVEKSLEEKPSKEILSSKLSSGASDLATALGYYLEERLTQQLDSPYYRKFCWAGSTSLIRIIGEKIADKGAEFLADENLDECGEVVGSQLAEDLLSQANIVFLLDKLSGDYLGVGSSLTKVVAQLVKNGYPRRLAKKTAAELNQAAKNDQLVDRVEEIFTAVVTRVLTQYVHENICEPFQDNLSILLYEEVSNQPLFCFNVVEAMRGQVKEAVSEKNSDLETERAILIEHYSSVSWDALWRGMKGTLEKAVKTSIQSALFIT